MTEIAAGGLRPQALLLAFFAEHVLDRRVLVATGSLLDVLERAGVSEHATRSTLSRMARGGLLCRVRRGRQVYLGLTRRSQEMLSEGGRRVWHSGVVNEHWDGTWVLLGFSLPESWQRQRHELRSQLTWAGFAPLQGGLWVAPSGVDLTAVGQDLAVAPLIRVFAASALPPTDVDAMVRDAWDLAAIAGRYTGFLERWELPERRPRLPALAQQLTLDAEWLQVIAAGPAAAARHLPPDWPAERAQQVFRALHAEFEEEARSVAAAVLDTIPAEDGGS
ncbi:PaaX family transcriptional regulator [Modestobacter sp. VKM Ac-2676]|nr:PaaX family transcriptional regulator [Modestobacter sp. VKM Ac-2676]